MRVELRATEAMLDAEQQLTARQALEAREAAVRQAVYEAELPHAELEAAAAATAPAAADVTGSVMEQGGRRFRYGLQRCPDTGRTEHEPTAAE